LVFTLLNKPFNFRKQAQEVVFVQVYHDHGLCLSQCKENHHTFFEMGEGYGLTLIVRKYL
jgi:hypothetical protein